MFQWRKMIDRGREILYFCNFTFYRFLLFHLTDSLCRKATQYFHVDTKIASLSRRKNFYIGQAHVDFERRKGKRKNNARV